MTDTQGASQLMDDCPDCPDYRKTTPKDLIQYLIDIDESDFVSTYVDEILVNFDEVGKDASRWLQYVETSFITGPLENPATLRRTNFHTLRHIDTSPPPKSGAPTPAVARSGNPGHTSESPFAEKLRIVRDHIFQEQSENRITQYAYRVFRRIDRVGGLADQFASMVVHRVRPGKGALGLCSRPNHSNVSVSVQLDLASESTESNSIAISISGNEEQASNDDYPCLRVRLGRKAIQDLVPLRSIRKCVSHLADMITSNAVARDGKYDDLSKAYAECLPIILGERDMRLGAVMADLESSNKGDFRNIQTFLQRIHIDFGFPLAQAQWVKDYALEGEDGEYYRDTFIRYVLRCVQNGLHYVSFQSPNFLVEIEDKVDTAEASLFELRSTVEVFANTWWVPVDSKHQSDDSGSKAGDSRNPPDDSKSKADQHESRCSYNPIGMHRLSGGRLMRTYLTRVPESLSPPPSTSGEAQIASSPNDRFEGMAKAMIHRRLAYRLLNVYNNIMSVLDTPDQPPPFTRDPRLRQAICATFGCQHAEQRAGFVSAWLLELARNLSDVRHEGKSIEFYSLIADCTKLSEVDGVELIPLHNLIRQKEIKSRIGIRLIDDKDQPVDPKTEMQRLVKVWGKEHFPWFTNGEFALVFDLFQFTHEISHTHKKVGELREKFQTVKPDEVNLPAGVILPYGLARVSGGSWRAYARTAFGQGGGAKVHLAPIPTLPESVLIVSSETFGGSWCFQNKEDGIKHIGKLDSKRGQWSLSDAADRVRIVTTYIKKCLEQSIATFNSAEPHIEWERHFKHFIKDLPEIIVNLADKPGEGGLLLVRNIQEVADETGRIHEGRKADEKMKRKEIMNIMDDQIREKYLIMGEPLVFLPPYHYQADIRSSEIQSLMSHDGASIITPVATKNGGAWVINPHWTFRVLLTNPVQIVGNRPDDYVGAGGRRWSALAASAQKDIVCTISISQDGDINFARRLTEEEKKGMSQDEQERLFPATDSKSVCGQGEAKVDEMKNATIIELRRLGLFDSEKDYSDAGRRLIRVSVPNDSPQNHNK